MDATVAVNRDNCLPLLLAAFQPDAVVKALVFLPAVSDDFYLIHRGQPPLNLHATNLLAAVAALTNSTGVRLTFKAPLLLVHMDRDYLEPAIIVRHQATVERLKAQSSLPRALVVDSHWQHVQPLLESNLRVKVVPSGASRDAWHFARHNLRGWNLSDWELLNALSLTGKTKITVRKNHLGFEVREPPKSPRLR